MLGQPGVGEGCEEVVVQGEVEVPPVGGPEGDHGSEGVVTPVKVEKVYRAGLLYRTREGKVRVPT